MSWLGSLITGSDPTLEGDINESGNIAGFGENVGEGDIGAASKFDNTLLSGNQAAISKELAPQIGAITAQGQQKKRTMAEFGNRSGGENSAASAIDDQTRADINNMQSELTSNAAKDVGSLGLSSLGLGLNASKTQAGESEQQLENQDSSLLSGAITGAVGGLEDIGLGDLSGMGSSNAYENLYDDRHPAGLSSLSTEDPELTELIQ